MNAGRRIKLSRLLWPLILGLAMTVGLLWMLVPHSAANAEAAKLDSAYAPRHAAVVAPRGGATSHLSVGAVITVSPRTGPALPAVAPVERGGQASRAQFTGWEFTLLSPPLAGSSDLIVCMGSDRVWGLVSPGETVTVTVGGIQMGASQADNLGFFWTTLYDTAGGRPGLAGGHTLEVYQNGVQAANVTLRSISGAIDVLNDAVTGTIGGASFPVSVTVYATWGEPTMTSYSQTVSTDGGGNFSADFTGLRDFVADDVAVVAYIESGVEVHRHVYANRIAVLPFPRNRVHGWATPGAAITTTVYSDATTIRDQVISTTDADTGRYQVSVTMLEGDVVVVELADGTVMTRTVDVFTPPEVEPENDQVIGEAIPSATVRGLVGNLTPLGWRDVQTSTTADASGVYTLAFGGIGDIMPGQWAGAYVADAEGDDLALWAPSPSVEVNQTWNEVYGWAAAPPGPLAIGRIVTLTLYSAAADTTSVYTKEMEWYGDYYFSQWKDGLPDIAPGDVVTVESEGYAWQASVQVTPMAVQHDQENDQFNGTVEPPTNRVELSAWQWQDWDSQNRLYPAGGYFDMLITATSPFTGIPAGFDVRNGVGYWAGHRTADDLMEGMYREVDWVEVNPRGNALEALLYPPGTVYTITLYNSGGGQKAQVTGTSNDPIGNTGGRDFWGSGQRIEVGDYVQVQGDNGFSQTVDILPLSVFQDADNDLISGQGPPNTLLYIEVENQGRGFVPTDGSGQFGVAVNQLQSVWGDGDLQTGNWVGAWYRDANSNRVLASTRGPWVRVNYGHDWVEGDYPAGHTLWITVTDSSDVVKATVAVSSTYGGGWDGDGFGTHEYNWSPQHPDIAPGDRVYVQADDGYNNVITVGTISGYLHVAGDSITGTVSADFAQTLSLRCEVWVQNGPDGIDTTVYPDGLDVYQCDFSNVGWDVVPGQDVAVQYYEPDGDRVINIFQAPWMRVNYGHDWVGGNYQAGHTVWITVTDGSDAVKGTAVVSTTPWAGGGEGFETRWEDWSPQQPDILPDDRVYIQTDDGYNNVITVGTISGYLDVASDSITGTVSADFAQTLSLRCEVWVEAGPDGIDTTVYPDGLDVYQCDFSNVGWDVVPGQDVAVQYYEPDGDRVINVFREPPPHLRINKSADGNPSQDGNFVFHIQYWNDGGADAEGTLITDTLEGMTYLYDTSSFAVITGSVPGGEYVAWDLGTLGANSSGQFDLFVRVTAPASETITNTVQITTSNPYDEGAPGEKEARWSGHVEENDTHLNVGKWAWTGDPAPDTDLVFTVNACNSGSTGSSEVVLTDTLPLSLTLQSWWSQHPGWTEVISNSQQLVVLRPSMPGGWCSEVYLRVHLGAADPGDWISNTVVITASNDMEDNDNQSTWEGQVGDPHTNLYIRKGLTRGQLVAGAEIVYEIHHGNNGNVPVSNVLITDTLPVNTTFGGSWRWTESGEQPITPTLVTPDYVVWDVGPLDNGFAHTIRVALQVDHDAPPGTVLTNTAEISPQPQEDRYDDNSSTWVETVHNAGPNLRVSKYHQWEGEDRLFYGIFLGNLGTTRMEDIWITDTYPVSTTSDGNLWVGHGPTYTHTHDALNRQFIIWAQELDPGNTGHVGFWVDLDSEILGVQGLIFTNTVEAPWPGDIDPADNEDVELAYSGPDVYVKKWLSGGEPRPGQIVTFSVEFGNSNVGPWHGDPNMGSHITDTLPSQMEFITATVPWRPDEPWGPESISDHTLAWSWGPMWSDSTWQFDVVVQITNTVEGGDVITNRIEAYGDSPADVEPFWDNNVFELPITILAPRFEVGKVYMGNAVAGTAVTYTLTVTNTGNETGTNVVLSDTLPPGLTYGGSDGSAGSSAITWTFDSIDPYGGTDTGWFSATLPCTASLSIVNDDYRVITSTEGVASPPGTAVSFDTIAPALYAAFDQSASSVLVGTTVYFTDTSTTDGSPIIAWEWDFGDSTAHAFTQDASHTYVTVNAFTVTLTLTDTCGYTDAATSSVAVSVPPGSVVITGPTSGVVQSSYLFTASVSPMTTTLPITYTWRATEKSPVTHTGVLSLSDVISFTWSTTGTKTLHVTATNAVGPVTATRVITISEVSSRDIYLPIILKNAKP